MQLDKHDLFVLDALALLASLVIRRVDEPEEARIVFTGLLHTYLTENDEAALATALERVRRDVECYQRE